MKMREIFAVVICLLCQPVGAEEASGKNTDNAARFGAYGDNYILYGQMHNNGWAGDDDPALRAHYSLRYIFVNSTPWDFLFSYTGEFDFYLGTRPSSPVINRTSNPALHLRRLKPLSAGENPDETPPQGRTGVDFGFEHESDGQTTEVRSSQDRLRVQQAYLAQENRFFDGISRGSNFFSLTGSLAQNDTSLGFAFPLSVRATVRGYVSQDYPITWGPLADKGLRLSDYNILRLAVHRYWRGFGALGATWTVGSGGLKYQSADIDWQFDSFDYPQWWRLPFYVRYHYGPLDTLSNYSQRQDYVGIGFKFAGF